ncbi:MAG: PH domain-containing protein [Actinomycetota bacterium]
MPLSPKHLNENEELILDIHPHWWYFAQSGGAAVAALVAWYVGASRIDGGFMEWLPKGLGIVVALALVWVGWEYLQWRFTNFAITNARVIYQEGLISKKGVEIPLERVNNVNFNQTIIERILGAGDLLIESGGQDGQQRFTDIKRPQEVKKILLNHVQRRIDLRAGYVQDGRDDVATQLEKLEGLLQRGSLTREEFDREKRRLLGN